MRKQLPKNFIHHAINSLFGAYLVFSFVYLLSAAVINSYIPGAKTVDHRSFASSYSSSKIFELKNKTAPFVHGHVDLALIPQSEKLFQKTFFQKPYPSKDIFPSFTYYLTGDARAPPSIL